MARAFAESKNRLSSRHNSDKHNKSFRASSDAKTCANGGSERLRQGNFAAESLRETSANFVPTEVYLPEARQIAVGPCEMIPAMIGAAFALSRPRK